MSSPRPLLAILTLAISFQFGLTIIAQPAKPTRAQPDTSTPQAKPTSPDYSQEAMVIEQLKTSYRFEKDGTGRHEVTLRVKLQSEAAVERFGPLIFSYISTKTLEKRRAGG